MILHTHELNILHGAGKEVQALKDRHFDGNEIKFMESLENHISHSQILILEVAEFDMGFDWMHEITDKSKEEDNLMERFKNKVL